jgi:hypothetical protein
VWQIVGLKPFLGIKSLILLVYLVPLAGALCLPSRSLWLTPG